MVLLVETFQSLKELLWYYAGRNVPRPQFHYYKIQVLMGVDGSLYSDSSCSKFVLNFTVILRTTTSTVKSVIA